MLDRSIDVVRHHRNPAYDVEPKLNLCLMDRINSRNQSLPHELR